MLSSATHCFQYNLTRYCCTSGWKKHPTANIYFCGPACATTVGCVRNGASPQCVGSVPGGYRIYGSCGGGGNECTNGQWDGCGTQGCSSGDAAYCDNGTWTCRPDPTSCNNSGGGGTTPVCGNGTKEAGEQCDDGNTNNNDSCRNNCTLTPAPTPAPTPAQAGNFTVNAQCTSDNESLIYITWTPGSDQGKQGATVIVDTQPITFRQDISAGYWRRNVVATGAQTIAAPRAFTAIYPETTSLDPLIAGQIYYIAVQDTATNTGYTSNGNLYASAVAATCTAAGCGDSCSSDAQCSSGQVCGAGNTCILSQCINSSSCTNSGCSIPGQVYTYSGGSLPDTALISDEADRLLILGGILIILGFLSIKLRAVDNASLGVVALPNMAVDIVENWILNLMDNQEEARKTSIRRQRDKFEQKISTDK